MQKFLIAMMLSVFTVSAFACGENGSKGKEKQEEERIETRVQDSFFDRK